MRNAADMDHEYNNYNKYAAYFDDDDDVIRIMMMIMMIVSNQHCEIMVVADL